MEVKRGDVVLVADGKPRPAVVVQADQFPTPVMVLACPLTSEVTDSTFFRVVVQPEPENGLRAVSQLMVDRTGPIRRDRVGGVIGRLSNHDMEQLDAALTFLLDLVR